jgi:uncharacterized membrane-anchored protein
MFQRCFFVLAALVFTTLTYAHNNSDSLKAKEKELLSLLGKMDSLSKALKYETGVVTLPGSMARITLPKGFKYLNAAQSKYVLSDIWGNPPQNDVLGMIFPDKGGPFADSSYAFVVTFDAIGYVKDDDADKIDYDEMAKQFRDGEKEENEMRARQGYSPIHFMGWAQKPYYDKSNKVLHWAKELRFGTGEDGNTLNYDVRILGRKGVLSFNAVAAMSELELVKKDIPQVLGIAEFTEGNRYADFDPKVDNIAAWTIGGLVAGKVLAKAGFFALILKNIKLVAIGLIALAGGIWRFFSGRRKRQEPTADGPDTEPPVS